MEITLTTPALLFPAISLLLLAYTNRFMVLAQLVRELYKLHKEAPDLKIVGQIHNLQKRLKLIRTMQIFGASSFFACVLCMFLIFSRQIFWGELVFGLSLVLLMISLGFSIRELQISVHALNIQLEDCEADIEKFQKEMTSSTSGKRKTL